MLLFITLLSLTVVTVAIVAAMGHLATAPETRRPVRDWKAGDALQAVRSGSAVLVEGRQPVLDAITKNTLVHRAR